MKSSNYWDKRKLSRYLDSEKRSKEYLKKIFKIYEQANRNIQREIKSAYRNYSTQTGIDVQKLMELLTKTETSKHFKELKKLGYDKYVKNNYKSRINRLERLQLELYKKVKEIYPKEVLQHTNLYKDVVNNGYYKAIYDTQIGTGYDFNFATIDDNMMKAILSEKWHGGNYSSRVWGNTDILANQISEIIGGALLSGQGQDKTAQQIRERFNVGKYYAKRLVRTETNYFNNQADAMAYEEMGIDKYVYVAVLDSKTSEICQSLDNKVFKYKDMEVGVNYPPMHPNCRSTTRGYLGEEVERMMQRRATNPITGESELIGNISYKEWYKNISNIKYNANELMMDKSGWYVNTSKTDINDNMKIAHKLIDFTKPDNKTIYDNIHKLGFKINNDAGKDPANYEPSTNTIHIHKIVNVRSGGTIIHEMGHAIDLRIRKGQLYSKSGNLTKLIDDFIKNNQGVVPKEFYDYKDKIYDKVQKELTKRNYNGIINKTTLNYLRVELGKEVQEIDASNRISDIFSALTEGKMNSELFSGHSENYWSRQYTKEAELFAQFTYLKMTNSSLELRLLKNVAPDIYNELDNLYKNVADELRRL
jgi:SPP1 gp7 family putative phage head morphogenesis protein